MRLLKDIILSKFTSGERADAFTLRLDKIAAERSAPLRGRWRTARA